MKTRYFLLMVALVALLVRNAPEAAADPANPRPFTYTQPDGSTVTLVLHGDEFFNWTTDADGRIMERTADGFYRYTGATPASIRARASSQGKRNRASMRRQAPAREIRPIGRNRFLIMLVEFSDKRFSTDAPQDAFSKLANQSGYSENGSIGSVSDYYFQNSYGAFQPQFDVIGPITLDRSATDFPEGDSSEHFEFARDSFLEAMRQADADVDFSLYDLDGDGYIDNVFFIYPGEAQSNGGGPDTIWPHAWGFWGWGSDPFDGVRAGSYACSSELVRVYGNRPAQMCGIGTICHEFGHVIGLPDVYDTDYEKNGSSLDPGSFSLMAGGNHNNGGYIPANLTAFEKNLLGWMDLPMLEEGMVSLPDLGNNPVAGYIPTDNEGEWYVFESRDGQGWDTGLPAGLLVFHLDRSNTMVGGMTARDRWLSGNGINDFSYHPCYTPLVASQSYSYNNSYIPFPGRGNVTQHSFKGWSGDYTGYRMNGISYSNSTATFNLEYYFKKITGTVRDNYGNPLKGVTLSVSPGESGPAYVKGRKVAARPARISAGKALSSTTSGEDGTYTLAFESQELTFDLYAEKDKYIPYTRSVSFSAGEKVLSVDPELKLFVIGGDTSLHKYNQINYVNIWGLATAATTLSASVRFSAEDLADHAGKLLSSVDLYVVGDSAEKLYIIVDADGERVLFHQVDLSRFKWDEWCRIDLTDEQFTIPEGKDLYIGYGLVNVDYRWPWAADDGPEVEGGFCYYSDVTETAHVWWEGIDANLLLGVNLSSPSTIDEGITLLDLGINYISPLPKGIRAGDTLRLSLVKSPSHAPKDVEWYCDGEACSTTIQAESGIHTVKAVLSFKDGHTETLETQYRAE